MHQDPESLRWVIYIASGFLALLSFWDDHKEFRITLAILLTILIIITTGTKDEIDKEMQAASETLRIQEQQIQELKRKREEKIRDSIGRVNLKTEIRVHDSLNRAEEREYNLLVIEALGRYGLRFDTFNNQIHKFETVKKPTMWICDDNGVQRIKYGGTVDNPDTVIFRLCTENGPENVNMLVYLVEYSEYDIQVKGFEAVFDDQLMNQPDHSRPLEIPCTESGKPKPGYEIYYCLIGNFTDRDGIKTYDFEKLIRLTETGYDFAIGNRRSRILDEIRDYSSSNNGVSR